MALVDDAVPMRSVFSDTLLIVGGALVVIGSFEPWTFGKVAHVFVISRNGFQLDGARGFSPAGVFSVVLGAHALLTGALHLAQRQRFRILDRVPSVDGLGGIAVGLYGLGEARWYVHQLTVGYPGLFSAGTRPGVWLVLVGGIALLVAAALETRHFRTELARGMSIVVVIVGVGLGALALAPR